MRRPVYFPGGQENPGDCVKSLMGKTRELFTLFLCKTNKTFPASDTYTAKLYINIGRADCH